MRLRKRVTQYYYTGPGEKQKHTLFVYDSIKKQAYSIKDERLFDFFEVQGVV